MMCFVGKKTALTCGFHEQPTPSSFLVLKPVRQFSGIVMNRIFCSVLVASGLALALPATAAESLATTLSFDEFAATTVGQHLPEGYAGFDWGDRWFAMRTSAAPGDTFLASSTVGSTLIRRSDGSDFHFDGADFFSRRGLDANGDFFFVLYHDGATVYQGNLLGGNAGRMRFTGTPTLLAPDYAGPIDGLAFGFDNDDYDHLAMDNFRFRVEAVSLPVPEPEPYALLLTGLGLVGMVAGRRLRSPT